jgi:hypothetical protein
MVISQHTFHGKHIAPAGSAAHPIAPRWHAPAAWLLLAGASPQHRRALQARTIAAHPGAPNRRI